MRMFPAQLQDLQAGWIDMFALPAALRGVFGNQDQTVQQMIEECSSNLEEDFHSMMEAAASAMLHQLRQGECSFFSDPRGFHTFLFYLSLQYLRTRRIRDRFAQAMNGLEIPDHLADFSPQRVAGILRVMLATSITSHFVGARQHFRLALLRRTGADEFITGDQPVVNTYARSADLLSTPEKLEFYYPISPDTAVIVADERDRQLPEEVHLRHGETARYNDMVARAAQSQVYASAEQILRELSAAPRPSS